MNALTSNLMLVLPLAVALCMALAYWVKTTALPALRRARAYSSKMQECGYLPAPPTDRGQRWMMRYARFFTGWLVGKVEIIGIENLDSVHGKPIMVTPDHPMMTDVVVVPYVIERKARYMAALGVMQAFGGLGALLTGPVGAFGCDLRKGRGGPARLAAIEVLKTHQTLVMWPEGWTNLSPVMGPFKKGAVNIARTAAQELGEPVYIVPMHLHYGRYPGQWIKKFRIDHQYMLTVLCFPFFRRGVKVVIGEPISSNTLHEDDEVATENLKATIFELKRKLVTEMNCSGSDGAAVVRDC